MKMAVFEIGKKAVFFQFLENQLNNIDVVLAFIFGLNQDIIQINNHKNVEFLGHNLLDLILIAGRYIG